MTESDRIPYYPQFYKGVNSTNETAAQFVRDDAREWTIIWTHYQQKGKGQQGNRWESNPGENLLASWILYPHFLEPWQQFLLSVINSLAILDLLRDVSVEAKIKWPNDVYVEHEKLAGMLIENSIEGNVISNTIIGTGLNINQTHFSEKLQNPVSLKMLTGKTHRVEIILKTLHEKLYSRYQVLKENGITELLREYVSSIYLLNEFYQYEDDSGLFMGRIVTVESSGLLVIEDTHKRIRKYAFKEVSFPMPGNL